jgi:hypothetical protein
VSSVTVRMNIPWKRLYFLPMLITVPVQCYNGFQNGYTKYNNLSFGGHVFGCLINSYGGVIEGAFIGLVWPVSGFVAAKRYLDK